MHLRYGIDASERVWKADNLIMNAFNPMLPDVLARGAGAFAVASREGEDWGWEAGGRLDTGRTRARGSLAFVQAAPDDMLTSTPPRPCRRRCRT